ncbi:MAG: thioredoxin domain-containing protein [Acidobacteriia bacterium]|nr:thioredoxin domain-containing protein [Terriglobia bacterium]
MKLQLKLLIGLFALLYSAASALAADGSSLKPPPGARVAIVVFEDLECPTCARTYPVVWDVGKAHNVPVVLHDYPIPSHAWSFDAAVYARYFDTHSQKLGDDFRGYIYKSQINITRQNLRQFVQKYADDNKVPLPFVVDPEGKLKAKVKDDFEMGQRMNVVHTPTIFVIGGGAPTPFVEVSDPAQLSQTVEDMQKKYPAAAPAKRPAVRAAKKKG